MLHSRTGLIAILALASCVTLSAGPITHTLNFTDHEGNPWSFVSGSFTYDADTPAFSDFTVEWRGFHFDLTNSANSPNLAGSVPCLAGLSGAAASFGLLTGACADQAPYFVGLLNAPTLLFEFYVSGPTFPSNFNFLRFNSEGPETGFVVDNGAWTVDSPEPSSALLLFTGLALLGLTRFVLMRAGLMSIRVAWNVAG